MTDKLCGNCTHREKGILEDPCLRCSFAQRSTGAFPNWEPMTPEQVDALYSRAEKAEEKARRWRRKAKRLKKRIEKQDDQSTSMSDHPGYGLCMYCEFSERAKNEEPCNRCRWLGLGSNDEWRPKTSADAAKIEEARTIVAALIRIMPAHVKRKRPVIMDIAKEFLERDEK